MDKPGQRTCKVKITYLGPIRSVVRRSEDAVTFTDEKPTVRTLINVLAESYGEEFRRLMLHGNRSNRGVTIFVNGQNIIEKNDLDTELEDESEVEMLFVSQAVGG